MYDLIRSEHPEEFLQTEQMVMRAFWNLHGPGCNEHLLVRLLRESEDYLPALSRVAVYNGKVVGAIFYSLAHVVSDDCSHEVVTFGPLCVEPTMQHLGIGTALLQETIPLAKQAGYSGICILGETTYYPKFGFQPATGFGITLSDGSSMDALMALPLNDSFSSVRGKLIESPVFEQEIDSAILDEMNRQFSAPPKIKVEEGFLALGDERLSTVETVLEDGYLLRFWERLIPAKLAPNYPNSLPRPKVGDTVVFEEKEKRYTITRVYQNLLSIASQ